MTIQDVAKSEGISERQAQRYCREGYKGHVLNAAKIGRGLQITDDDYKAWRVACGFDAAPVPEPEPEKDTIAQPSGSEPPIVEPCPAYPPWPLPANPGGPITNVPHPSSGSMPHPLAVADHEREMTRKQMAELRGYDHED
jgi:hypothetical protein